MKIGNLILIVVFGLALIGCQGASSPKANQNSAVTPTSQEDVVDRGTPFSDGPATVPSVKGPDSPPPSAQAVTTNENIRLTLPLKTQ